MAQLAAGIKEIPYNSVLHRKIIEQFELRLQLSRDAHSKDREKAWREAEDTFQMYVKETDADALRKENRRNGKPTYTNIQVPYSYAMLLTSHTYYTSVFLARDPIMQMRGRHGEAQNAEQAVESLLDYQLNSGQNLAPLFIWLLDVGKYGVGILGQYWDRETVEVSKTVEKPETFLGVPIPGRTKKTMETTTQTLYQGSKVYNVRPQDFFHDPRVPLWRFQEGEFTIEYDKVGWNKIQQGIQNGRFFNHEILRTRFETGTWEDRDQGSSQVTLAASNELSLSELREGRPSTVETYIFVWEIVPSQYGLSAGTRLEKWVFVIANRKLIISAQPLALWHGKYPYDVLIYEMDGYNLFTRGQLEIMDPINKTIEWLFNSHMWNVRASMNNNLVVDQSRINVKDLETPEPGKLIRLKPAAFGLDIRTMVQQLQVQDITRANLADVENVGLLGQRVMGVTDNVMGMVNSGGRKTATEVRNSTSFGINRLKTSCEWFSTTGFAPLAFKMLMTSQQMFTAEQKLRIVGNQAEFGGRYITVTPDIIQGVYDFVPVDGTMPIDRFAQVNTWNQLLQTIATVPQVGMQYDIAKIFGFVAQLGGIKNISQFRVQVVPDGVMQGQAQAGNVIPMRGNLNEPGQVPMMGATG